MVGIIDEAPKIVKSSIIDFLRIRLLG